MEVDSLWRSIIAAKYGLINKWETKKENFPHGVGLWKGIALQLDWFNQVISMNLGIRNDCLFWSDRWCSNRPLKIEVPLIFNLALNKLASVADYWDVGSTPNNWNVQLRRNLNDWEVVQMAWLIDRVHHALPNHNRKDSRRWSPAKDGSYSVRSAYGFLEPREEVAFQWKDLWKIKAPSKVLFFTWTALKGQIPTMDFLIRRGSILPNMCPLCKGDEESADHILIHSPFTCEIWFSILLEANMSWVRPDCCSSFFSNGLLFQDIVRVGFCGAYSFRRFGGRFGWREINVSSIIMQNPLLTSLEIQKKMFLVG